MSALITIPVIWTKELEIATPGKQIRQVKTSNSMIV